MDINEICSRYAGQLVADNKGTKNAQSLRMICWFRPV